MNIINITCLTYFEHPDCIPVFFICSPSPHPPPGHPSPCALQPDPQIGPIWDQCPGPPWATLGLLGKALFAPINYIQIIQITFQIFHTEITIYNTIDIDDVKSCDPEVLWFRDYFLASAASGVTASCCGEEFTHQFSEDWKIFEVSEVSFEVSWSILALLDFYIFWNIYQNPQPFEWNDSFEHLDMFGLLEMVR